NAFGPGTIPTRDPGGGPPPGGAVSEGARENRSFSSCDCDRTTSEGPGFNLAARPERGDEGGGPPPETLFRRQRQTPLAHLLGGQTINRRRRDIEHRELQVKLSTVVDLVFDHQAQPFPDRDRRASGSFALAREIGVVEPAENRHRLRMEIIHVLS